MRKWLVSVSICLLVLAIVCILYVKQKSSIERLNQRWSINIKGIQKEYIETEPVWFGEATRYYCIECSEEPDLLNTVICEDKGQFESEVMQVLSLNETLFNDALNGLHIDGETILYKAEKLEGTNKLYVIKRGLMLQIIEWIG